MYFNVDPIYLDNVEYLILRLCNCVWTYIGYLNMHVFFQASSELSDGVCALPIFIRYPEGLCGSHLTKYSNIYPFCLQKPCLIGCSKYFQIPFAGGCPEMGWIIPSFDQFPHAVCGSKAAKYPMNPYELVAIHKSQKTCLTNYNVNDKLYTEWIQHGITSSYCLVLSFFRAWLL